MSTATKPRRRKPRARKATEPLPPIAQRGMTWLAYAAEDPSPRPG